MNYIDLCGMNLSQIVLGTDGYSQRIDKKTAFELMDFYVDNGGNVIDTARMYCNGTSELYVGEFIKNIRDRIYISTKCAFPDTITGKSRLTEADIEYDIDMSLKALQIECIDILWLHRDDANISVQYIIDILNKMLKKGKIKTFGASNWYHDRIMQANNYALKSNQMGFIASQPLYNMATRSKAWDSTLVCIEGDEKAKYDKSHFPVFAFSSQAKGFFEKYAQNTLSEKAKERYLNEKTLNTYKEILNRSKAKGDSISYTALSMLIEQSNFNVFPIIGPSNLFQLGQTLNTKSMGM